jgi:hypothetical protein
MRLNFKKSIAVTVAALTLTVGLAATSQSAFAGPPGPIWHHPGYYGGHYRGGWWGPAIGLGIVGGLVAGAAIANSGPYYGPGPGPGPYYGNQCWQPRPMYDAWGRYIGTQPVNVCQ